jgi:branched-chain amino acid transport system substrate-binding protein
VRWIALFITAVLFAGQGLAQESKIKIGISVPLTGGSAAEGNDISNVLLFANKEFAGSAYELVLEDDQCSTGNAQTVSVAHKFTDLMNIKYVLGFACSGAVLAAAPIYEKAKTVVIAVAAGAPAISAAGDYIFRTMPNLNIAAQKLYAHAAARFKTVGILSEETAYCQGLADAFCTETTNPGVRIEKLDYLPGTSDFRTLLVSLRQRGTDAVFLNPQSEEGLIVIYRNFIDQRWPVQVYGSFYPGFAAFLKVYGPAADGIIYSDLPFIGSALSSGAAKLYEKYKKDYGTPKTSEFYFITTLSAFLALDEAIRSGKEVKDYLYGHKFQNVMGDYAFDRNGDVVSSKLTYVLKHNVHGASALLEE